MPQIIVTADRPNGDGEPPIMFQERVNVSDFESEHFASQLVERLGWAVGDADELNRRTSRVPGRNRQRTRAIDAARRELAFNAPRGRPVRPVS